MSKRSCLCSSRASEVTLHAFPKKKDENSLRKKICTIRTIDEVFNLFVCSNHFTAEDYVEPNAKLFGEKLRLKPGRFPSVRVPHPVDIACDQEPSTSAVKPSLADEMSMREQMLFENNRLYGGVDFGTEAENNSDNVPLARLALVFMAVAINNNWKVPIGYFLIKFLTGSERANLLCKCLELVQETGADVCSITFEV